MPVPGRCPAGHRFGRLLLLVLVLVAAGGCAGPSAEPPPARAGQVEEPRATVGREPVREEPARTAALPLGLGGVIGELERFAPEEEALAYLQQPLGPPDGDSGWILPLCGPAVGEVHWRLVRWGALELLLLDTPIPGPDGAAEGPPQPHVAGWIYHQPDGPVDPELHTAEGLTLGSTRDQVEDVYGSELQEGIPSTFGGASLLVSRGELGTLFFDLDPGGRVVAMTSGQGGCGD